MFADLNKMLDKAKLKIFANSKQQTAFMAPLLCQCNIDWDKEVETACTDGINIFINPDFFKTLTSSEQAFVLFHELWHIAKMHRLRGKGKDHTRWNYACDYHINYMLVTSFSLALPKGALLSEDYANLSEEEIYEKLPSYLKDNPYLDLVPSKAASSELQDKQETEVVRAVASALKAAGKSSNASILELVEAYMKPQVNWRAELQNYFKDTFLNQDYSWKRPSRRFTDIYMPSLTEESEGRLEHLAYFVDTSGSITEQEILRFNSEIKAIKDELNPKKLSIIQFDNELYEPIELSEDEPFHIIEVVGRGGTSLEPVYDWIQKNKPTASVIFSDLCCKPMKKPSTPVIWCVVGEFASFHPPFGKIIPIKE